MDQNLKNWDLSAERYQAVQAANRDSDNNEKLVRARFRTLQGQRVLDVGCGYGQYTDYFRRIGGEVIGCDGAPAMLALARRDYPDCRFDLVDLMERLPYEDHSFDLLFCNQVLMDLPEVDRLFAEFSRVLKSGGILYLAIVHPMTYPGKWVEDENGVKIAKQIGNYTKTYSITHTFCGVTNHYHRPVSVYLNLAADARFRLVRMEEPDNGDAGMPLFLVMEFRKD
ncbi:MAG: class I SAM-dependent methyltransferase [Oscillibacter sp.]|nr:class I SAM-dependent methyltransferase [Oscillibacter sp.]